MGFKEELDRVYNIYNEKGFIDYTDVIDLNKERSNKNFNTYGKYYNNSNFLTDTSFIDDLTMSNNDKRVMINAVKYNLLNFDHFFVKIIERSKSFF